VSHHSDRKSETHDRIVRQAAREFRGKGLQGIGIADLMSKAGLTHGGFYAHFGGKDALIEEAATCAAEESIEHLVAAAESAGRRSPVEAMLHYYLHPAHRDNPAEGCVLASLAQEIARQPDAVRKAFTRSLKAHGARLARYMPGDSGEEKLQQFMFLISGMAGALAIARAIAEPTLSNAWLASVRRQYAHAFRLMAKKKVP
jgi:TetR/AcrR family transcriptional repressor of nem operon